MASPFTDLSGAEYAYRVDRVENVQPQDVAAVTESGAALTLHLHPRRQNARRGVLLRSALILFEGALPAWEPMGFLRLRQAGQGAARCCLPSGFRGDCRTPLLFAQEAAGYGSARALASGEGRARREAA